MLTENTVTKLQEMHLSAMAKAFKDQLTDPNMADMSFEDRFGLIVDHEWTTRKNNHLSRLIKSAAFAEPNACVEDIEYHADRNLDKTQIARLACCDYITDLHTCFFCKLKCKKCLCIRLCKSKVRVFCKISQTLFTMKKDFALQDLTQ